MVYISNAEGALFGGGGGGSMHPQDMVKIMVSEEQFPAFAGEIFP